MLGGDRRGAGRVAGITARGAGLAGAALFGMTALDRGAGWESAGGAFRALSSVEPSRSELVSELWESGSGGVVIAGDGPIGGTLGVESSAGGLKDRAAGLSECNSDVAGPGGFTAGVTEASGAGVVEGCEDLSRR